MMPLGLLSVGEIAEVAKMPSGEGTLCHSPGSCCNEGSRMEDLGIRTGKTVEMLTNGGSGPILLKVDEARIAIGRGIAMRILVRRKK